MVRRFAETRRGRGPVMSLVLCLLRVEVSIVVAGVESPSWSLLSWCSVRVQNEVAAPASRAANFHSSLRPGRHRSGP